MTASTLDHNQLRQILPQAYPFMLIDRVIDFKKDQSLVAIKNITANEWPFTAFEAAGSVGGMMLHLPGESPRTSADVTAWHYPETLLIEAAAQSALVLYHLSRVHEGEAAPRLFLGRVKSEFFAPVSVGSQVHFNVTSARILAAGGYSDIDIFENEKVVSQVWIIYKIIHN